MPDQWCGVITFSELYLCLIELLPIRAVCMTVGELGSVHVFVRGTLLRGIRESPG